ncbi:MAG TPA: hypothetical protein VJM08_13520, partial [Anaerolineales bacterium]|nr:hypothetical protein [Anaerolineales bacterium]
MQDQQILNSTITIEEVVDKGKKLSIKGHNGQRVSTYSIWKTKTNGDDSLAYAQYKTMGLGTGSTVMIGYVIDEYVMQVGGPIDGEKKRVRSNKIISFRETNEVPPPRPVQQQSSN